MRSVLVPGLTLPPLAGAERLDVSGHGVRLGGYVWPQPQAAPLFVLLHGYGQDAAAMVRPAEALQARGAAVVSLSMRGWRGSGGCDDYGRSHPADLRAALGDVRARVPASSVVLLGFSMGGLMALLAARQGVPLDGVVAVSAPTDLRRVYETTGYRGLRRYYDAVLTPEQWVSCSPARFTRGWRVPTLNVMGLRDTICPPWEGQSFAAAVRGGLLEVPDMGHEPGPDHWPVIVEAALARFAPALVQR